MNDEKINKIIGHRFGDLTVIGRCSADRDTLICECKCGRKVTEVKYDDLYACKVLSCPVCQSCRRDYRKKIVLEYGTLTDYDYASDGVKVCSYCGKPSVYAHNLCKACLARTYRNGGQDASYIVQDKMQHCYTEKQAKREHRKQTRVENFTEPRCQYGNKNYEEMRRMYAEDGMTYAQIADKFGVSRQRVYQCLHKRYKRY